MMELLETTGLQLNMLQAGVQYTRTLKSCMTHFSCITSHLHNSPANLAKDLFKHSYDVRSLLVKIFENWNVLEFGFEWVTSQWG